jgi:hypothetical protein
MCLNVFDQEKFCFFAKIMIKKKVSTRRKFYIQLFQNLPIIHRQQLSYANLKVNLMGGFLQKTVCNLLIILLVSLIVYLNYNSNGDRKSSNCSDALRPIIIGCDFPNFLDALFRDATPFRKFCFFLLFVLKLKLFN